MMISTKVVSFFALLSTSSNAFVNPTSKAFDAKTSSALESGRRQFVENVASITLGFLSVGSVMPSPAIAEVSQGDSLPDGAAQFKRLINLKSDIPVSVLSLMTFNSLLSFLLQNV